MDLAQLEGKRIALVVNDERDESVAFTGIAHWDGDCLFMLRNKPDAPVQIQQEWHHKIRATSEASKYALLGAEFFVMLRIGDMPTGADESGFQKTGLKWRND